MVYRIRTRKVFSVRIDPKIAKVFTDRIKETNLSTCLVVEALLVAWVEGSKYLPPASSKPKALAGHTITITQNFQRVVKRERRKSGVTELMPEDNCYVKNRGGYAINAWTYVKPANKSDINKFGHHVSCVCLDCSGRRVLV
jgi:hypothetical protein